MIQQVWPVYELTITEKMGNKLTYEEQKQLETLLKKMV
ncbi:hypothetical protein J2736_001405 [Paenibacillus qinlingensis]|uniref:Uncharacterized protein n=1 Tax=Paenibacillus qinlingensis TaxID=1837343 RepID=A0ABU1NTQ5_9BACL|nr:hypothetical protein [Paenibacillus qinlingensis]